MSKSIKKAIKSYLSQKKRVNKKLNSLVPLLNQSKDPVSQIRKRVKETKNPLKLFKALMLIHVCYLRNILNYRGVIKLLSYIKPKEQSKQHLKNVLGKQVIPQYKLYLQLCYQAKIQDSQTQKTEQRNKKYSESEAMEQIYKNIALLKNGLSFVQILFLFGRYYRFQYFFIVDFNIVLAKDMQIKYNKIASLLTEFKQLENDALFQKLEKLHQDLYVVYFNCYYHPETKKFQPNWIETDVKSMKNHNQETVIEDNNISELIKLYEQMRNQNNNQPHNEQVREQNNNSFQTQKKIEKTNVKNIHTQKTAATQKRQTDSKECIQFSTEQKTNCRNRVPIAQISQFEANQQLCESEQESEQEESNEKLNEVVLQIFDDSFAEDDRQQKYSGILTSEFNEDPQLLQICGNQNNIMELIDQNTLKI